MADSTVIDYTKMKVTDLRKELKARGLPSGGDKSELVARIQTAASKQEETEYALDSDEIDSDSVLEDDDDKTAADTSLDDSHLHDELADLDPVEKPKVESKPKTLKRKLIIPPAAEAKTKPENGEGNESAGTAKKIVLHRPASVPATEIKADKPDAPVEPAIPDAKTTPEVVKAPLSLVDPKAKLEMRAKRFGLPMTDSERKEARKIRFGQTASSGNTVSLGTKVTPLDSNVDKLKKRAERFGQAVPTEETAPKGVKDVEAQERLEKRRAKFGLVK